MKIANLLQIILAIALPVSFASSAQATVLDLGEKLAPLFLEKEKSETTEFQGVAYDVWTAESSPAAQEALNESFEIIYSTRAAQSTLLSDSGTDEGLRTDTLLGDSGWDFKAKRLKNSLGVPIEITARLLDRYSSKKQSTVGIFGEARGGGYQIFAKHYYFLISKDGSVPKFDSFTFENNRTIIFVDPARFDRLSLLKILAHEVAISSDQKSNLSASAALSNYGFMADEKADQLPAAELRLKNVNAVFQVVRAHLFERDILAELLTKSQMQDFMTGPEAMIYKTNIENEKQCRELALWHSNLLTKMEYVQPDTSAKIQNLFKTAPKTKILKKNVSTCAFASRPFSRAHGYRTKGPRPRIGDWNGRVKPGQDLPKIDLDEIRKNEKWANPLLRPSFDVDNKAENDLVRQIRVQQYSDIIGQPVKVKQ